MNEKAEYELTLLRREIDHQRLERVEKLENRIDEMAEMITTMARQIDSFIDKQKQYELTMNKLQTVMQGGVLFKWMIAVVVGTLMVISTGATAWDTIQKVLR